MSPSSVMQRSTACCIKCLPVSQFVRFQQLVIISIFGIFAPKRISCSKYLVRAIDAVRLAKMDVPVDWSRRSTNVV